MKSALIVLCIMFALNAYCAFRLSSWFAFRNRVRVVFLGLFAAFFILQSFIPIFDWARILGDSSGHPILNSFVQAAYVSFGIASSLFVYVFLADVVAFFVHRFFSDQVRAIAYRNLAIAAVFVTIVSVGIGMANAGRIVVERVDVPIKNLPTALEGLTIAQISDVHVGRFLKRDFVQKIVSVVQSHNPDLIVLTGDYADGYPLELGVETLPFSNLQAPLGKFFVTGNHEYYWAVEGWLDDVRKQGFTILSNAHTVLEFSGAQLLLAGVPDPTLAERFGGEAPSPALAIQNAPKDVVKIMLSHQPKVAAIARDAGFDAQISGHTHAGQYFPFTRFIGFFQRYYQGMYDVDGMPLYVSRGVGFWGPPLRAQPGEIGLITLRKR